MRNENETEEDMRIEDMSSSSKLGSQMVESTISSTKFC